jgi:hypothetical protein
MTKRVLLSLAACAILQTAVWGVDCATGTLQSYLDLAGGCTIGDKSFSDFALTPSGDGIIPTAAQITVTPVTTGTGEIGLNFNALWFAGPTQSADTTIAFDVAVTGGGAFLIDDASTVQLSSSPTGTGVVSVGEGICTIASPPTCFAQTSTFNLLGTHHVGDHVIFAPTGAVRAFKDIGVAGGPDGTASISAVQDTFSQTGVPEPTSIVLLGSVMVVIGGFFRRRQAQKV